jgi:hypothetical protein
MAATAKAKALTSVAAAAAAVGLEGVAAVDAPMMMSTRSSATARL